MKTRSCNNKSVPSGKNNFNYTVIGMGVLLVCASLFFSSSVKAVLFSATPKLIPTATGEILPEQMGITSVHEHIAVPYGCDSAVKAKSIAFVIAELKKAKSFGLNPIMEVGPINDVEAMRQVSIASEVNVVCCAGFYVLKDD
jgi:hypothetical protein